MLDLAALLKDNSRLGMQHGLSLFSLPHPELLAAACALFRADSGKKLSRGDGNDMARRHRTSLSVSSPPLFALGCQIILSKELEGMELKLPEFTRNFYVDGHVPQPH
jgi:hypothetical protein